MECRREKGHVYYSFWECLNLPADPSNGGFLQRYKTENFYQCIANHSLFIGSVAMCIPTNTCTRMWYASKAWVCYDVCPPGTALQLNNRTCAATCNTSLQYSAGAETRCV